MKQLGRSCPSLEHFEAPCVAHLVTLRGLATHAIISFYRMDLISLCSLKNVKAIRATMTGDDTPDSADTYPRNPVPVLLSLYKSLRQPVLDSDGMSYRLLDTITDLELLFDDHSPKDLEGILRSAPRLESLTMVPFDRWDNAQQRRMYQALTAIPSHLTCFHSLTVGPGGGCLEREQLDGLCGFLMSRSRLRRIVLRSILTAADAEPFCRALMTLGELDALALTLDSEETPPAEWLGLLSTHVPSRLTVLALEFHDGFASKDTFVELVRNPVRLNEAVILRMRCSGPASPIYNSSTSKCVSAYQP